MKARIKQNAWGNWYGYLGTRRVMAFTNPFPGYGAQQEAEAWLEKQNRGGTVRTLLNTKPVVGMRVRWISERPDLEPQGALIDVGYGAVTIGWDDEHSPSSVPRSRWDDLEVLV